MTAPRPLVNVMKVKLWLRQRAHSAPRLTISRRLSWPVRTLWLLLGAGCVGAVAFGGYDLGRRVAVAPAAKPTSDAVEIATAAAAVAAASTTAGKGVIDTTSVAASVAENQMRIERSARQQLAAQVKVLEAENGKLKDDLAFFESLLPADKTVGGVSVRRLAADVAGPNQLRYRLVVMRGGKSEQEFTGTLQVAVTVLQNGKSAIMIFPEPGTHEPADTEKFQLAFKRYQRVEGLLTLPDGAVMKSMQVRVLEKGQLRAQQTTVLERRS